MHTKLTNVRPKGDDCCVAWVEATRGLV